MRGLFIGHSRISCRRLSSLRNIQDVLKEQVPKKLEALKQMRKTYGPRSLGSYTLDQCLNGGINIPCMFYEASEVDPVKGICFRGYSIPELQRKLPSVSGLPGQGQPTPEGMLWLLLTSEIPTAEQAKSITEELRSRSSLPQHVISLLQSLPKTMDPMTQLSIGLLACQPDSKFVKARAGGTLKAKYWESVLEDALDIIAKLPEIAAIVYRHTFKDGQVARDCSNAVDYASNFILKLGFEDSKFAEFMRLYLVSQAAHDGGSPSTHATRLAGCTLSDPYLSCSAGLNATAGPLHEASPGLLQWMEEMKQVKRATPNIDWHSGALFSHYGLQEQRYHRVLFAVSRAIGALSQLVWDRALQLPLENPKSVDMPFIVKYFASKGS